MIRPNQEQMAVADAVASAGKRVIAINALAGTGKTTTLTLLAKGPLTRAKIRYITFNSRAAAEARHRFGPNTTATTAHSHAWHSLYPESAKTKAEVFAARLVHSSLFGEMAQAATDDARLRRSFATAARALHLERSGWRAGISPLLQVLDEFTKSGDLRITSASVPLSVINLAKKMNATDSIPTLAAEAQKLWNRQIDPDSALPIPHGLYLKLASLHPEPIDADVLFFDEAQDASALMLGIIEAHVARGGRLVMVGDKHQHIYAWAGALNAIDAIANKHPETSLTLPLCQSYRFGGRIAEAGNIFLDAMGADYRLVGLGPEGSTTEHGDASTILFRSNVKMITEILASQRQDPSRKIHVVGGTKEMTAVLSDLANLYASKPLKGGELAGFVDWTELKSFAETPLGSSYSPLVTLVERLRGSVGGIIAGLRKSEDRPEKAHVILSTAHKAKGAQWGSVKLSEEFQNVWEAATAMDTRTHQEYCILPDNEELALQYVAATRAEKLLAHRGLLPKAKEHLRMMRSAQPVQRPVVQARTR